MLRYDNGAEGTAELPDSDQVDAPPSCGVEQSLPVVPFAPVNNVDPAER